MRYPRGKTQETLTLNGITIDVDPKESFTWYDRQVSYLAPANWTWFEVRFPESLTKASIWTYDFGVSSNEVYQFATVRFGDSIQLLPYGLKPDTKRHGHRLTRTLPTPFDGNFILRVVII